MKTELPYYLLSKEMAEAFLTSLVDNGESYHCDDDAHEIMWTSCPEPSYEEKGKLNHLMKQVFTYIPDPCQFILDYSEEVERRRYYQSLPRAIKDARICIMGEPSPNTTIGEYLHTNLIEIGVDHISIEDARMLVGLEVNEETQLGFFTIRRIP